jgi:hypothetical protein
MFYCLCFAGVHAGFYVTDFTIVAPYRVYSWVVLSNFYTGVHSALNSERFTKKLFLFCCKTKSVFLTWTLRLKPYLLTPRSRILLATLTVVSQSRHSPHLMEHEGPLPLLQASATCPYPEPDQTSPCPHSISWRLTLILSSRLRLGLQRGLLPLRFPHQNPVYASPLPHTCYMTRPNHSPRFHHPNYKEPYWRKMNLVLRYTKKSCGSFFITSSRTRHLVTTECRKLQNTTLWQSRVRERS